MGVPATGAATVVLAPLVEDTTRDVCVVVVVAVVDAVWGTAKAVVAAAEVELVKPKPVAGEVAGVLLAADEPTPKEGKVVVEAAAEEVAAGVEEEVVVVVVATENSAGDVVVDAGAELAGVANENEEEDDEAVCEIAGVELAVGFEKESPEEAEKGEGEGLVVVVEEVLVENPNGDGEEADKDDAK